MIAGLVNMNRAMIVSTQWLRDETTLGERRLGWGIAILGQKFISQVYLFELVHHKELELIKEHFVEMWSKLDHF